MRKLIGACAILLACVLVSFAGIEISTPSTTSAETSAWWSAYTMASGQTNLVWLCDSNGVVKRIYTNELASAVTASVNNDRIVLSKGVFHLAAHLAFAMGRTCSLMGQGADNTMILSTNASWGVSCQSGTITAYGIYFKRTVAGGTPPNASGMLRAVSGTWKLWYCRVSSPGVAMNGTSESIGYFYTYFSEIDGSIGGNILGWTYCYPYMTKYDPTAIETTESTSFYSPQDTAALANSVKAFPTNFYSTSDAYTLGTPAKPWGSIYLKGASIYMNGTNVFSFSNGVVQIPYPIGAGTNVPAVTNVATGSNLYETINWTAMVSYVASLGLVPTNDPSYTDTVYKATTAYSWGNHALGSYVHSNDVEYTDAVAKASSAIQIETDPVFTASVAYSISSGDTDNWHKAYGWGDHSVAGYVHTNDTAYTDAVAKASSAIQTETDPIFNSMWDTNTYNQSGGIVSIQALSSGGSASGVLAEAEGSGCRANGNYSHAGGDNSVADGISSFAHGLFCYAKDGGIALGNTCEAWFDGALALGYGNCASGTYAVAIGYDCHAEKPLSLAIGFQCNATATGAQAWGAMSIASNFCSYVWSDGQGTTYGSHGSNSWSARSKGGFWFDDGPMYGDGSSLSNYPETDPVFTSSVAAGITDEDTNHMDIAYRYAVSEETNHWAFGHEDPTNRIYWIDCVTKTQTITSVMGDCRGGSVTYDFVTRYKTNAQDNFTTVVTGIVNATSYSNWVGEIPIAVDYWFGLNPTNRSFVTNWNTRIVGKTSR